jgi:RimJ/RimL family protein N-acetyltransferase
MSSNPIPERIETDRLRLDRLDEAIDVQTLYEYAGASETIDEETRYMSWTPHDHLKESADVRDSFREKWENLETASYAIFPHEGEEGAGEFAGTAGLGIDWEKQSGELGIWLRKPFWGRGYSAERANALAVVAFEQLDLDYLKVWANPENEKSNRAIRKYVERFGGRHEGLLRNQKLDRNDEPVDVHHYSISQAEWRDAVGEEHGVSFTDELPDGV